MKRRTYEDWFGIAFFAAACGMLVLSARLCFADGIWYDELFTMGLTERSFVLRGTDSVYGKRCASACLLLFRENGERNRAGRERHCDRQAMFHSSSGRFIRICRNNGAAAFWLVVCRPVCVRHNGDAKFVPVYGGNQDVYISHVFCNRCLPSRF